MSFQLSQKLWGIFLSSILGLTLLIPLPALAVGPSFPEFSVF